MVMIDNRNLFFEKLRMGINLFTGAGFSALPSDSGNNLPIAQDLAVELCEKFSVNAAYAKDLEKLSSILKRNCKKEFQDYLRKKYTISDYNKLYDVLNKMNIESIITTNIDNLIPLVMDNSQRYYLNTVSYYGPTKKDGQSIQYIPLHGDVLDVESELYFGKFELCDVGNQNRGLFSMMQSELLKRPTLFWGYGFHDGSVSGIIDQVLNEGKQDIWVQVRPNSDDIQFFRDIGCHVIVSDTEELLKEIENEMQEDAKVGESFGASNIFWKKYAIPTINQIESMPIRDFYEYGKTHWYYALTNRAYLTQFVNRIIDSSLENKNLIVVGIPFGGKTTLLMQVACRINKPTYFISDLNDSKAKLVCNNATKEGEKYIVLIDNCSEDMVAYRRLAECPQLITIATSDDFMYESSKHILEDVSYKKMDIPDLDINEAQRIFENIPEDIRTAKFTYKQKENEKYSILELVAANVQNVLSQNRVEESLNKIKHQNEEAFELILLTAYLIYHKSALTTDVLIGYYGMSNVDSIKKKIEVVRTYLSEMNMSIDEDIEDQDYFSLRSSLFAQYTHGAACKSFKEEYGKVISKFIHEVSPCYIYKDYVFKRRAYDAGLFLNVFGDSADEVYSKVYRNDPSAYTLQQWALYKAHTGRFSEAFSDIDKAIHLQPNNFSVKNARAIILFEANKDKETTEAKKSLEEAMDILEKCYLSDKRKVYHAQKYAEFALKYFEKYSDSKYIEQAFCWLDELIKNEESMSFKTRKLFTSIKEVRK